MSPAIASDTDTAAPPNVAAGGAIITAVTSGKGGVGKTFVTANLAAALARQGERVLVLDADLGLANLDVVLNLYPKLTLHDVFTGQTRLEDAILPAPGGFSVLLAGSGVIQRVRPRFDRVLLDTGAGISDVVLYTISLADEVLIVCTPEPTSLTDAYATIKVLATTQPRRLIRLLVNQVQRPGEARAIRKQLQLVVDRFVNSGLDLPVMIELLGEVPFDPTVRESVIRRELLLEGAPGSPAGQAIVAAAAKHLAG
jgi:flagellar biosynthesis protein FlhG